MAEIRMTFRDKEILKNHPIVKSIIWMGMCYIVTGVMIIGFILFIALLPFLMILHYILCILTLGKFKLIKFEQ